MSAGPYPTKVMHEALIGRVADLEALAALGFEFRVNGDNLEYRREGEATWQDLGEVRGPEGDPGVGIPAGGITGQLLGRTASGTAWVDAPSGGGAPTTPHTPMDLAFSEQARSTADPAALTLHEYSFDVLPPDATYFPANGPTFTAQVGDLRVTPGAGTYGLIVLDAPVRVLEAMVLKVAEVPGSQDRVCISLHHPNGTTFTAIDYGPNNGKCSAWTDTNPALGPEVTLPTTSGPFDLKLDLGLIPSAGGTANQHAFRLLINRGTGWELLREVPHPFDFSDEATMAGWRWGIGGGVASGGLLRFSAAKVALSSGVGWRDTHWVQHEDGSMYLDGQGRPYLTVSPAYGIGLVVLRLDPSNNYAPTVVGMVRFKQGTRNVVGIAGQLFQRADGTWYALASTWGRTGSNVDPIRIMAGAVPGDPLAGLATVIPTDLALPSVASVYDPSLRWDAAASRWEMLYTETTDDHPWAGYYTCRATSLDPDPHTATWTVQAKNTTSRYEGPRWAEVDGLWYALDATDNGNGEMRVLDPVTLAPLGVLNVPWPDAVGTELIPHPALARIGNRYVLLTFDGRQVPGLDWNSRGRLVTLTAPAPAGTGSESWTPTGSLIALGDSLTSGEQAGGAAGAWPSKLAVLRGWTLTQNAGVGGSTLSTAGSDPMVSRWQATVPAGYTGHVALLGGTNDYGGGLPLGAPGSTDTGTVYGALLVMGRGVLERGLCMLDLLTPLWRGDAGHTEGTRNAAGYTLEQVRQAVRDVAARLEREFPGRVQLHDMGRGLTDWLTGPGGYMNVDNLHLTAAGHTLIAQHLDMVLAGPDAQ